MEEQHKSKIVWVLFIIIVALVGLNIYQYYLANNLEVDTEVAVVETSATPTTSTSASVSATPTATTTAIANNVFDLATAKVGDKVGTMTITSIEPYFPDQSSVATDSNCKITFSGEATISGYFNYVDTAMAGFMLIYTVDEANNLQLPMLQNEYDSDYGTHISFKHDSNNLTKLGFTEGLEQTVGATVKVNNYSIKHAPTEVMNTADLVEVVNKY